MRWTRRGPTPTGWWSEVPDGPDEQVERGDAVEVVEQPGRYQHSFVEGGSYRAAVGLVAGSGRVSGLVVDLGCGYGAVAEPVRDLGLTYVGTDLAGDGLIDLASRGFETHVLDLRLPHDELVAALEEVTAGRDVAHLLALDVLEHLADPGAAAAALATFALRNGSPDLVVSYPNITHLDVAAKLLVGRWDRTDEGLLDRTHLQFFGQHDLVELFAIAGWDVEDAADVESEHSDQSFPDESPVLRPDTPLRDLLRAVRRRAEPSGATYQFVRRYALAGGPRPKPEPAEVDAAPSGSRFATVLLVSRGEPLVARDLLEADLAEQGYIDFDIRSVAPDEDLGGAVAAATGRYVVVVTGRERLAPGWMAAFLEASDAARGRVLRAEVGSVERGRLATLSPTDLPDALDDAEPVPGESFDPLAAEPPGVVVAAAFAVPGALVRTMGVRPDPADGDAAVTVFLARSVELAGLVTVPSRSVLCADDTEPGLLSDAVVEAMAREPFLLPAGAGDRLLGRRTLAATARETEERLQIALAGALEHARGIEVRRDERAEALTAQLRRLEAERDDLRATVARLRGERRLRWLTFGRRRPPTGGTRGPAHPT